jgi:GTPase
VIDRVELFLKAGNGGAGVVSFRREKFVPRGGPDGGDGGRGGNIYLQASPDSSTLSAYRHKHHFRAERGGHGSGKNQHGRKGKDLQLAVPLGTTVTRLDEGEPRVVADLLEAGQRVLVARGGRGGWGNQHFKSATNQAPQVAQSGQQGEDVHLLLDLKLVADVGVIGLPNSGKSTFVAAVSAARPRIADYPFTTLEPVPGVVELGFEAYVVAEIPGLIAGAAAGAGLGLDFLRHAERARLFLHLIDGSRPDPVGDYRLVNNELAAYDSRLAERRQLVAVNKVDLPHVSDRRDELKRHFAEDGVVPRFISAAARIGLDGLLREMLEAVKQEPLESVEERGVSILRPKPVGRRFEIKRRDGRYEVKGINVSALAGMMDVRDDATREEFIRQLEKMGVGAALRRAGIAAGDLVRIGEIEFSWAL